MRSDELTPFQLLRLREWAFILDGMMWEAVNYACNHLPRKPSQSHTPRSHVTPLRARQVLRERVIRPNSICVGGYQSERGKLYCNSNVYID